MTRQMSSSPGLFPWRIERPVFVIAPPRSGSTFLFECLVQFRELTAFTDQEGSSLWRRVMPYDKRATVSDAIQSEEFAPWRRRSIHALFYGRSLAKYPARSGWERVRRAVREPRMRYLDKSIENTFRLPLLREMFPDATFVYLVRNPRANVASMINGWSERGFSKPTLDRYLAEAGSTLPHWTYAAPPGWRAVLDRSLPEICAWSWEQHARAILDFRAAGDPGPLIRYEDLVADPRAVVADLAATLDLQLTPQIEDYLAKPPPSRTTLGQRVSATEVTAQVEAVLPLVAGTAARLGYPVEP